MEWLSTRSKGRGGIDGTDQQVEGLPTPMAISKSVFGNFAN